MADNTAVLSLLRTDAEEQCHGPHRVELFRRLDSSSADCSGVASGASDAGRSSSLTSSGEPDSRSHSCSTISADPAPDTAPVPAQQLPRSSGSRRRNRRSAAASQPAKPATSTAAAADPHHGTAPCDAAQHPLLEPETYDHAADAESPGRSDYCISASPCVSALTPPAFAATPRSVQRRQRGFGSVGPAGDLEVLVDLAGEGDLMRATAAVAAALLPPSTMPVRIVVARAHAREAGSPSSSSLEPTQPRDGHAPAPGGRSVTSKPQLIDSGGGDAAADGDAASVGGGGADAAVGPDPGLNGAEDELTQMATAAAAAAAAAAVAKASTISVVRSRTGAGGRAGEGGLRSPGARGPGNDDDFGALPHSPGAGGPNGGGYSGEVHGDRHQHHQHHQATAKTAAASAGVGGGAADGGGGKGSTTTATRRRLLRTAGMLQVAVHPREDLGHVYCTAPPTHQPLLSLEPVTLGAPVTGVRGHSHVATTPSGLLSASPGGAPPPSPGTPGNGAVVSPGGRRGGSGRPPRSPKPTGAEINGVNSPGHGIAGSGGHWRAGGAATALDRTAAAGQHASLLTMYGTGYTGSGTCGTGAAQMPYNTYGFMPQPPPPPPRRAALESPQLASTGYRYEAFQLSPRSPEGCVYRQEEYLQQQLQQHSRDAAALSSAGMLQAASAASPHGSSPSALLSAGGTAYRRQRRLSGTSGDVVQLMPLGCRTSGPVNGAGLGGGGAAAATVSQGLSGVLEPAAAWAFAPESHSPELSLSALQIMAAQAAAVQAGGGGNDLMLWSDLLASSTATEQRVGALGAASLAGGGSGGTANAPMRRFSYDLPVSGRAANYPSATDPWVDAMLTPEQIASRQGSNVTTVAASPCALTPAATPPYSPVREGVVRPASSTGVAINPFAQRLPQGPILATATTGDPTLDVISAVNWSVGPFSAAVRSLSCAAAATSTLTFAPSPASAGAATTTSGCRPTAARTGGRSSSCGSGSNAGGGGGGSGSSTSTASGGAAGNANSHELPALRSVSYPATPRPPPTPSLAAPPSLPGPCAAATAAVTDYPGVFLGREAQESPLLTSDYDMNIADVVAALAAARQLMPGMVLPGSCRGTEAPATAGEAMAAAIAAAAAGKGHQLQLGSLAYLLQQHQQ